MWSDTSGLRVTAPANSDVSAASPSCLVEQVSIYTKGSTLDQQHTISVSRRTVRLALAFAVVLAVLAPVAVIAAGGTFVDDDTSIFEDDIEWLVANAVTSGCGADTYCPEDNVTRGQMAAFMRRLATKKVVDAATAVTADSATTADSAAEADNADTVDGKHAVSFFTYGNNVPGFSTLTGAWGMGVTAAGAGDLIQSVISFPVRMNGDLEGHIIAEGDPAPAGCSGSVTAPAADPGHLCIFTGYTTDGGLDGFYRADDGFNNGTSSPFGVTIYMTSDNAGTIEGTGTWAATSPLTLIMLPAEPNAARGAAGN